VAEGKEPPKGRPKKRIVLRAASKPDPYAVDTTEPVSPEAQTTAAEAPPMLSPAAVGSVPLPPVIATPKPDPERKRGRPLGLAISIVGGAIASFAPLLTWWKMSLSLLEGAALEDLPSRTGVQSIPGLICLVGGLTILMIGVLLTTKPLGRRARLDLGSAVMVAGIVVAGGAVWALMSTGGIDPLDGFVISPQLGIKVTLLGGVIAVPGGYLLMREAQQAVTYVQPTED